MDWWTGFRNVKEPYHDGTTWTVEHVLRQKDQAGFVSKSDMPFRPKDWVEEIPSQCGLEFRNVKEPYHDGTTWTVEHVLRQKDQAGFVSKSDMPFRPKDWVEEIPSQCGLEFRNVKEPYHDGITWTVEHVLRQKYQAGYVSKSDMPFRPKYWVEGTIP
ncbi:hypothetical protein TNCV_1250661 [Trichonephila clavipes]|nr:hypothetical protein TNCV_1250661 [Trichonephila clavipes]